MMRVIDLLLAYSKVIYRGNLYLLIPNWHICPLRLSICLFFEIAYRKERKMIRFFYVPLAFRGDRILLPSQLIFPT